MTRSELDTLRAKYLTMVPKDFIRGAFFSKDQLEKLLSAHADASGLFFYILPDESEKANFTIYAEAFDANQKPYPEEATRGLGDDESGLEGGSPCPPDNYCP
jgi:hypothetical protein